MRSPTESFSTTDKKLLVKTYYNLYSYNCVFQVLAACFYPALLEDDSLPLDVRQRAKHLLRECEGGSVGEFIEYGVILSLISQYSKMFSCKNSILILHVTLFSKIS